MTQTNTHNTLLDVQNLACRRGGRMVFSGLTFTAEGGAMTILRGPNGTGKSSFLRLAAGLGTPHAGRIVFPQGERSDQLIYCGHQDALKSGLTLAQNLRDWAAFSAGLQPSRSDISAAAARFGLEELLDHQIRYFSSGQRHRASLCRLLMTDRPIWLLDEPTVGLDSSNRETLSTLIKDHLARGGAVLAATHDPLGVDGATVDMGDYQPQANMSAGQLYDSLEEVW